MTSDAPDVAAAARTALRGRYGADDSEVAVASAPGRVNLVGGHTDYQEGFVLPAAIDRRTAVAARPRDDGRVRAYAADLDAERTFALDALAPPESPDWVDYVRGVIAQLRATSVGGDRDGDGGGGRGLDLAIRGTVPRGAGLSSSAALEAATAGAVLASWGDPDALDREALADLCWRAETEFVGVDCGIMDQYAAVFGERDRALFLDCRERTIDRLPLGDDARVVVLDTNVERELVDSAYNERVRECRAAVEALADWIDSSVTALRDVSVAAFERHRDALSAPLDRRAEHVIRENRRVREAAAALADGDLDRLGGLMYDSHESLRANYEVSCAELDAAVEIARESDGVVGARMTGAGFGGSVVAVVRANAASEFASRARERYAARTGIDPDVYPCAVADGYRVHGE